MMQQQGQAKSDITNDLTRVYSGQWEADLQNVVLECIIQEPECLVC